MSYGSRTEAQFGCGTVSAQAVFAGIDATTGLATYAVRVVNNSEHALLAFVRFGLRRASELSVAPFSITESIVPRPQSARPDDRAIVEVRGTGLALAIDAPSSLPARRLQRFGSAAAAVVAAAGSLALAGGVYLATNVSHARAVAYAPAKAVTTPVTHHATRAAVPSEPLLDALDVRPASVIAGKTLHVHYGAHAQSGDVWLLDAQGHVWARSSMDVSGVTALVVPQSAAGRDLRVVVSARRGGAHAQMSATVTVLPDATNVAQSQNTDDPAPSNVAVAPERVPSGGSIHIRLPKDHGEALVSVTDQGGSILEEVDVEPGRDTATLRAPQVGTVSTYDVVITITKGNAQDQTVKAVTVVP